MLEFRSVEMQRSLGKVIISEIGINLTEELTKNSLIEVGKISQKIINTNCIDKASDQLLLDLFNKLPAIPDNNQRNALQTGLQNFTTDLMTQKGSFNLDGQLSHAVEKWDSYLEANNIFGFFDTKKSKLEITQVILNKKVLDKIVYREDHPHVANRQKETLFLFHMNIYARLYRLVEKNDSYLKKLENLNEINVSDGTEMMLSMCAALLKKDEHLFQQESIQTQFSGLKKGFFT